MRVKRSKDRNDEIELQKGEIMETKQVFVILVLSAIVGGALGVCAKHW